MSRGVRDLRDLICVSRLTLHESKDDEISSDEDCKSNPELTQLSESESDSSKCLPPSNRVVSPDSGFITNESPGTCHADAVNFQDSDLGNGDSMHKMIHSDNSTDNSLTTGKSKVSKTEKKRRRKKLNQSLYCSKHELPRPTSLPEVHNVYETQEKSNFNQTTSNSESRLRCQPDPSVNRVNFDDILPYMDATLVANWLTRSNVAIQELSKYCCKGDSFVQFAHFWLSQFPDTQKKDIFAMEYEILLHEFTLAFAVGTRDKKVVREDIVDFCGAVFHEYPVILLSENGPHIFLDYLDILTSKRQEQYKKLLSGVHGSTSNRQYAQWLLASRSFAFVNIWTAVISFYRNLIGDGMPQVMPVLDSCSAKESIPIRRMRQAIRLGYNEVINYFITAGHVNPAYSDSHKRSLLFIAVMHGQTETVRYLLTLDPSVVGINQHSDTGNTSLHAASNSGNLAIVELLCHCDGIDVNCVNAQCDNATPLHLAVMHGHVKVVECLLKHGADVTLKMKDTSVCDLARDFDHQEILELLNK